jgi:adenylate cyclase
MLRASVMEKPSAATRAVEIREWLLEDGRRALTMKAMLLGALAALKRAGITIDRMWAGTRLLHPQAAAFVWIWESERAERIVELELSYARFAALDKLDSPTKRIRLGAPFIRARLDPAGAPLEIDDLESLRLRGYTDFFALPLRFRGEFAGAFTWATRAPGGFAEDDLEVFTRVLPVLSLVFEPLARELAMSALLCAYLGRNAGSKVLSGQVRRGDGQTIRAAIWFSDLRGFTKMSDTLDQSALLSLLSDTFEVIVERLADQGGEVLKFIGDGVLAIFAEDPTIDDERERAAQACHAARRATRDVFARLSEVHAQRQTAGLPVAPIGVGLHYGDVMYGNIGAPGRLDFTVIGKAVNIAARVEGQCSRLAHRVLTSKTFAGLCGDETIAIETVALKGIAEPVELYAFEP